MLDICIQLNFFWWTNVVGQSYWPVSSYGDNCQLELKLESNKITAQVVPGF